MKPGRMPFSRVGRQGELWHEQELAPGIDETQVHPAGGVVENPIAQQPFDQPIGLCLRVRRLNRQQHEQARPDPADRRFADLDSAMGDPLQKRDHHPAGDPGRLTTDQLTTAINRLAGTRQRNEKL